MTIRFPAPLLVLGVLLAAGCATTPADPPAAEEPPAATVHVQEHAAPDRAHEHAAPDHAAAGDLGSIMVGLGDDMTAASQALWLDDMAALATAADSIASHPHVSPEERTRIQGALGADFAGFVKADKVVHDSAARLADAARAKDSAAVLTALAEVQTGCVACHSEFRDPLR